MGQPSCQSTDSSRVLKVKSQCHNILTSTNIEKDEAALTGNYILQMKIRQSTGLNYSTLTSSLSGLALLNNFISRPIHFSGQLFSCFNSRPDLARLHQLHAFQSSYSKIISSIPDSYGMNTSYETARWTLTHASSNVPTGKF